jgi:hypothetical protein
MEALQEVTVWPSGSAVNHVYLLDGNSMLAYVRNGTLEPFWFRKPITISRSGRRFARLDVNPFDVALVEADPNIKQVQGSKGSVYTVNLELGTCTCQGYTFRGTCKHVKELA